MSKIKDVLTKTAAQLVRENVPEYKFIPHPEFLLPDINSIGELMDTSKAILFPGFFGKVRGNSLERLYSLLNEQINRTLRCFDLQNDTEKTAPELALAFIGKLPKIKRLLATDMKAVYDCDPAATGHSEVLFCYPAMQAMTYYRVAHELLLMEIPVLPRIITELAHSATGIDIHPGAKIGEYFSIDHGTGVVIGETCIIGNHVRLYQGVTLGAKGFTMDDDGFPLNIPRHPIIEDHVIIYSNSTILGRITIGHDSVIGGNVWQVYSVPPHSRITQRKATAAFTDGLGI
ncbi:MAG: serine acetyltransferase [Prevotellaceae bacterium]|jgi:serine O-acetyltransferase|nr:serine acetyltransferase [Prevotellaceae bacterium]